jgi:hypothetical protein
MTRTMRMFACTALTLASVAFAQETRQQKHISPEEATAAKQQYIRGGVDATTTCSFTFNSGTGNTTMKYCVTVNGNITQFASPSAHEYITTAPAGEGYAFCDFDSETQYFDYAGYGDSGNWKAPTTLSSSATAVKIQRGTTDGLYTLTQTITQNGGGALAQITMALKNNTTKKHHVGLLRWVDVDADNNAFNSFDSTLRAVFGYNPQGYGLLLQGVSGSVLNGAFAQDIPGGPNSCQIFAHTPLTPLADTDGSMFIQYDMQVAAGTTKTVVVSYKSF